ncbi:hypothetical protein N9393_01315 [Luminiphilus sp.]|nr:hypothetical protein [Luminiphilus sp.]
MSNSKATLLSLFLILLSACSEPTIDRDELVEREGIFYEKFSNEPYSGKTTGRTIGKIVEGNYEGGVLTYHENGQLESQQVIVRGVREGEFRGFDEEGNIELVTLVANGELNGQARFFKEGELSEVITYKNGVRHGLYESFSEVSSYRKGRYDDGMMVGKWELTLNADTINGIEEFMTLEKSEGRHPTARFHPNGQVAESGMRESGGKVGTWYYYDKEGDLTGTVEFVNGKEITDE